jgi:hypothetical protein
LLSTFTVILAVAYVLVSNFAHRFFNRKIVRNIYKPDIRAYTYLFLRKKKDVRTYFSENPATFCLEDERMLDFKLMYYSKGDKEEIMFNSPEIKEEHDALKEEQAALEVKRGKLMA